jgi:hypothetical protein
MNNKARALALSLALIGLAQLVAASLATASPVYPADFFTQATTQVWGNATDSGQLGTSAQSTNLVTTLYRSANGTFNTTGDGAVASMGGAAASANLATGQLRAEAGATLLVPALANAVGFPAQATTYMGDTLFFTAPGASLTTITTVGFTIHVEGTLTPIPNAGTSSGMGRGQFAIYIGQDSVLGGFDSTAVNVFQHYNHSENWYGTPLGTVTINEDIVGSFKFKGAAATVPILMWRPIRIRRSREHGQFQLQSTFCGRFLHVGIGSVSGGRSTAARCATPFCFGAWFDCSSWVAQKSEGCRMYVS